MIHRLLCAALMLCGFVAKAEVPAGFKLVFSEDFEKPGALPKFKMTDAAAWRLGHDAKGGSLELHQQSNYKPAVRSPLNIALIGDKVFGDFVLEADAVQTGKEYGHRDMCFYFGFQSPTNFYYVHIATAADDHAHNVFIVNGAPRVKIATETTKGVNWGLEVWHKIRIERRGEGGEIKVFFDDMTKPIMIASDRTFATGQIGFGSFDDTGKIDNIRIWSPKVEEKHISVFQIGKE